MKIGFIPATLAGIILTLVVPAVSLGDPPISTGQVQVADVIVSGNRNVSTDRIMSFLKIRAGSQYSREQLKQLLLEDTERLIDTRMFRNVVPQIKDLPDGGVNVYFKVQEYPNLIQDIVYKNANHISKKELAEMTRLRQGMPLDPLANKRAAYAIQDHLKKQGRYFANVILEEGADPGDKRVVFNITEGPVVRATKIRFVGNHDPAISKVLGIQIGSSTCGTFNPAEIDNEVLKLEECYKDNGYMDVQVTRELLFSDDHRSVTVVFHIHEGEKYRIQKVQVEGIHNFFPEDVTRFIRAKPGQCYKESVVSADVRNITDYFGWRGHKALVRKELYFPEPGQVCVIYDVDVQPIPRVGPVIIEDNQVGEKPPEKAGDIIPNGTEVNWRHDFNSARKEAETKGLPILLDFYTDDCVYCDKMRNTTYRDPKVMALLNGQFIPLKIDANHDRKIADLLGVAQYPTMLLAGADGKIVDTMIGYMEAPQFLEKLQQVLPATAKRAAYEVVEAPPAKVGQIIIVGNERTRDEVIRKVIMLYPGQTLLYPQLKLAERNLERLGIFEVNKEKGIRPTLTVLESDTETKDILVQVQEAPTGSLFFGAGFTSEGQIIFNMTLEERNFDPKRFPTCMADIREGRAFRGGGKTLRLDVFRLTAPGSLQVLRWYLK